MNLEEIDRLLGRIGVLRHPCDLDVLLFLARHPRSLLTGEQLATFLGHESQRIADSLELLLAAGLLTRSQNPTHAARLYVFNVGSTSEGLFLSLLQVASTRDGLLAIKQGLSRRALRLAHTDGPELYEEIVEAAIALAGADMGNMQLRDEVSGGLRIVAQRGFERPFLDFFEHVRDSHAACGTALARGERVIVDDVANSSIFADTPALAVLLTAGVRAVQSTPLVSRSGRVLGMFSTHYRQPRRPSDRELRMLDGLARPAADRLDKAHAETAPRETLVEE